VWDDLEGEIRKECGWGKSLRWVKECVDAKLRSLVSLCTLNQRVHERAGLVPQWREDKLDDVPPVVYMVERGICPERGLCLLVADGAAGLGPARRTVYWDVPF
jgi:hypothetical protein